MRGTGLDSRRGRLLAWAGLLFSTIAAYGPALASGLIWNDRDYITKPALQSLRGLGRIWCELGATEQYYPVLHSAFWLEHRLWGESALGYHLLNVLLHATAAGLFVLVLRRLTSDDRVAWFAGFLFALHPVCVESVAWISEQKNTLSTVFYLLAAYTYLNRRPGRYCLATLFFILAILSKSVAATLPAALLVVIGWREGRLSWRRDVRPLLPWFVMGAGMGLFSAWVERIYSGAEGTSFALTFAQRCEVAGRAVWFYLEKCLWPANLTFIYPRWEMQAGDWMAWLYPLGVVMLGVLLWRWSRRSRSDSPASRAPLAAFLFFIGSLFPTLGFLNVYAFVFSYVADHWQYLATLGIIALSAGGWSRLSRGRGILAAAVLSVLGMLTWRQCRMYRDVEGLYRVTLERNPGAWLAHVNLGTILVEGGHPAEAVKQFRMAARIVPHYPEIHCNLADALVQSGRWIDAVGEYEEAIRLNAAYRPAQVNLANTLVRLRRSPEAIAHYQAAIRLEPGHADWELGLGTALAIVGRLHEATVHDAEALRLRPDFPEAEYAEANAWANLGQLDEAMAHYRRAVALRPAYPEAQANLGLALATAGRPGEALAPLDEALRLRPSYAEAHAYRGLALAALGRMEEAVDAYRTALRLKPVGSEVHFHLGMALRALGRTAEAAEEIAAARRPPP